MEFTRFPEKTIKGQRQSIRPCCSIHHHAINWDCGARFSHLQKWNCYCSWGCDECWVTWQCSKCGAMYGGTLGDELRSVGVDQGSLY